MRGPVAASLPSSVAKEIVSATGFGRSAHAHAPDRVRGMSTRPPDDDDPYDDEVTGYDPYSSMPDDGFRLDYEEPPLAAQPWTMSNALNYGWQKYTENIWQMIVAGIALVIVFVLVDYVGSAVNGAITAAPDCVPGGGCTGGSGDFWSWAAFWLSWIPLFVIGQVALAVIVHGALAITRGERFDLRLSLRELDFVDVLVLSLITTAIAIVGLWLAVLPGLVAIFFTSYALYFLVDRGVAPWDAVKASARLVTGNVGKALLWWVVGSLIAIAGICFCGIGAALTVPLVIVGTAWTYRKLQRQHTA